ncbi:hydroquinone glucosyltransferase-like [Senna tora]|uniref:Hydroquinone glucosyltransferase-like n=1 Tax=Senna tora TaxID=362788 RepID=A0A834XIJ1_9FABA|nr:hydroquinone glucosyltransferase-like [Senna tora]
MHLTVSLSLPSFSNALTDLRSRFDLVALLVDLFSVDALEFAKKLEISSFVFFASSAANLSFLLYLPALDEILSADDGGDLSKPVKLPGSSIAIPAKHLPDMVHDRSTPYYKTMLHLCKGLHKADTILVNTFSELEPEAMKTFAEINPNLPVYSVGPVIQSGSTTRENGPGSECLDWLDKQPRNSVLYVCFGSGGSLSYEQTAELAWGLEMSGERFMWVVRPPSGSSISTYLSADKDRSNDPLKFLPDGFVDRVKDRGFLVQSWCPQIDVLKHEATGGFLTHCGWSSTVESLIYGKPTIAWPLFADQPVNAMMLTDVLKVAVTPKGDEDGIVKREEVSRCVKCVLESEEGKEMYKRVQMIKDAANTALGEKGSSRKNLENVVNLTMLA